MIHNEIEDRKGDHYAVGSNEFYVLAQLQAAYEQVRIRMTPEEALRMADLLVEHANKVKASR